MATYFPALITILAVFLLFSIIIAVGAARTKYGVVAPATTGHEKFERIFRVQMNTIENLVIFLPLLWLFSLYVSSLWAGIIGLVWIIGRIDYALSYTKSAALRSRGFGVSALALCVLGFGAAVGVVAKMFGVDFV